MKDIFAYHIIVRGRVQGVGYRAFASKIANSLGLYGYVQNRVNGTVEIEIEGNKEALDLFVTRCKVGPGWGRVDEIELTETQPHSNEKFRVKY